MRVYTTILDSHLEILPFFVRHYSRIGGTEFHVIAYENDNAHTQEQAQHIIQQEQAIYINQGSFHQREFSAKRREKYIRSIHPEGEWAFFCDLDEFAQITLDQVQEIIKTNRYSYVKGKWVDRIASDGSCPFLVMNRPLEEQYPCTTKKELRAIIGLNTQQSFVLSPVAPYSHHPSVCDWGRKKINYAHTIPVHHFKWQGNVLYRLKRRLERILSFGHKRHSVWYRNVKATIEYLNKHNGINPDHIEFLGNVLNI